MVFDDEVPTKLIRLTSTDFGPRTQEPPGRRIHTLGLPPPTECIRPDLLLKNDREVIDELRAERRSLGHLVRTTVSTCLAKARMASLGVAEMLSMLRGRVVLSGRVRTVIERTELRVKAAYDARIAVDTEVGQRLFVYPEVASRPGWILARTMDGEVGFVRAKHVS